MELSCPSKSSIIDPEFYSTFVKAEEKFEQLPDTNDGNCGFCAIAISIGKPEDFWPDVREHIYKELCSWKSHYVQLFLEKEKKYNEILQATHIKLKPNVPIPPIVKGWEDICTEQSKRWKLLFSTRITHFIEQHKKECEYLQKENIINLTED
ncbi:32471_t:CDS:2 [Gigaspora margarita]|uniref:32471_t:CDS:1 n=1 Tax=Gigaspora margarita TaxID=4874 RepID=A0ABN7VXL0_GIGMA|nr:32471_t:CDS:2 [Gigaspora margarita]